jgi:hypothetical protein
VLHPFLIINLNYILSLKIINKHDKFTVSCLKCSSPPITIAWERTSAAQRKMKMLSIIYVKNWTLGVARVQNSDVASESQYIAECGGSY